MEWKPNLFDATHAAQAQCRSPLSHCEDDALRGELASVQSGPARRGGNDVNHVRSARAAAVAPADH